MENLINKLGDLIDKLDHPFFLTCGHNRRFLCPFIEHSYEIIQYLKQYRNDLLKWAINPVQYNEELICPKCGQKINQEMKFCPGCGARINWWMKNL